MKKDSILNQISFMTIDMIYKDKTMKGNKDIIVYCNKEIKRHIDDELKESKNLETKNLSDYNKDNIKTETLCLSSGLRIRFETDEILYLTNGLRIKFEVDEAYNILAIGFGNFIEKNK